MIPIDHGGMEEVGDFRVVPEGEMAGKDRMNVGLVVKMSWEDFHRLNRFMREEIPKAKVITQLTSMDKLYIATEKDRMLRLVRPDGCASGRGIPNDP